MAQSGNQAALRPPKVFVGRTGERRQLESGLERARHGNGTLFVITGEPGIGKTYLAEEIADGARSSMQVLWGSCREEAGSPAYWPWVQVLESCLSATSAEALWPRHDEGFTYLAELVPSLHRPVGEPEPRPPAESQDVRFYLFDAVSRLLRAAAVSRPLLVVFDDLHAADVPSLMLLQFVAAELKAAPLVLIATHRDTPLDLDARRSTLLAEIGRRAQRLRLGGLREEEVGDYLTRTFEVAPPAAVVRTIHQTTDGNPFFVDEVARQLAAEGRLSGSELPAAELRVPHNVRALIRDRLAPLAADTLHALTIAAAAGRSFDLGLVEAASGMSRARVLEALAAARAAGLVREVPDHLGAYAFSHGLVRDTLYDDLDEPRRVRVHGRIAEALERLYDGEIDAHLAEIADHYSRAALGGDVHRAVEYALRAGRRAAALLAYELAAAHFEQGLRAIALAPVAEDRVRCELLLLLGEAAVRAGDLERGRAACLEAVRLARRVEWPEAEARAALALGGPWVEIGSVDGGLVRALKEALSVLPETDSPLRARVMARLGRELYWSDDVESASTHATDSLAMARRLGDAGTLAEALTARAYSLWRPDSLDARLAVEAEIVRVAADAGDREMALRGHLWMLGDLLERGDAEGLERQMMLYERLATEARQPSYLWYVPRNRAMRALLRGDFDDAERLAQEAYAIGVRAHPGLAAQAHAILTAVLRWERGDLSGLPESLEVFRQRYPGVSAWPCGQAFLYAEQRDEERARRLLARIGDPCTAVRRDANWLLSQALLALTCADLNDLARAEQLYEMLLPYGGRNVTMGRALICFGSTSHFLGTLAATLQRWSEAEAHFDSAVRMHKRMGARPWGARSRARWARMLVARAARDDRERALALFDDAIAAAESLGMHHFAARTREHRNDLLAVRPQGLPGGRRAAAVFRRDGDFWTVGMGDVVARLKDTKGMRCLAHLLRHPNQTFLAMELDAIATKALAGADSVAQPPGLEDTTGKGGMVLIDPQARAEYRARLHELRAELHEVTAANDMGRASLIRAEIEALTDELERAAGLRGRARAAGSPQERARINVTKQIKASIRRVATESPELADALGRTVRTGRLCSYDPDPRAPLDWDL